MSDTLYPLKLYLKYKPNLAALVISILLNGAAWLMLALQLPREDEQIFLHYTVIFGVDYLGPWWQAFVLPAIGLSILLINAALGWLIFHKEKFAALLINIAAVLCQIFLLIGAELLVFLNG